MSGPAFPRRLPPPPPPPRPRGWRALVHYGVGGLVLAALVYHGMVYQGALTVPAFRTPSPAHPYATEVKNSIVYLDAMDHWTLVLTPYAMLAGVALVFLLAERRRRRDLAEKNAAAARHAPEPPGHSGSKSLE